MVTNELRSRLDNGSAKDVKSSLTLPERLSFIGSAFIRSNSVFNMAAELTVRGAFTTLSESLPERYLRPIHDLLKSSMRRYRRHFLRRVSITGASVSKHTGRCCI